VLKQQHVVVARLHQGALEVIRLGKRDAPEVAPAQHLVLTL
jgi:hypothetical protein